MAISTESIARGEITPPPLGITPKGYWDAQRASEIIGAMYRYARAGKGVKIEWVEELAELYGVHNSETQTEKE